MSETKTMTREERMATEPIGRLMVSMTLPAILAQIINILYSIIDRIYIGHMEGVGANALTGVGVTFCITVFISAFRDLSTVVRRRLQRSGWENRTGITRRRFWETALVFW